MSIAFAIIHPEAIAPPGMPPYVHKVLLALYSFAGGAAKPYCWPSVATLAEKARVSLRRVPMAIRNLVETGWITDIEHGGGRRSNVYHLRFEGQVIHTHDHVVRAPLTGRSGHPRPDGQGNIPMNKPMEPTTTSRIAEPCVGPVLRNKTVGGGGFSSSSEKAVTVSFAPPTAVEAPPLPDQLPLPQQNAIRNQLSKLDAEQAAEVVEELTAGLNDEKNPVLNAVGYTVKLVSNALAGLPVLGRALKARVEEEKGRRREEAERQMREQEKAEIEAEAARSRETDDMVRSIPPEELAEKRKEFIARLRVTNRLIHDLHAATGFSSHGHEILFREWLRANS
ncbi:MAG: helix-turn-helix domain-containing protein [Magnetococcales bacterium]|nr:helix-turn-helix domain-containing protein [Magnetococcales bacterium]